MTEFRELEITIEKARASFRLSPQQDFSDRHKLRVEVARLNKLRATGARPTEYGAQLFHALFCGHLADGYRAALQHVLAEEAQWRIRLNIAEDAQDFHCLWWESLYDDESSIPHPLGRWRATPLSRYLGQETKKSVSTEKIKVLAVISNPSDLGTGSWAGYAKLDETAEREVLEAALDGLRDRVQLEFQTSPASFARIRERLKNEGFHVLHIVGHAAFLPDTDQACLLLEKDDETARPISHEKVGELVENADTLQLVVLAACHSAERSPNDAFVGLAPQMIRYGVPAVVAMQDRITETTARVFTEKFYRALGSPDSSGGMVDAALNWARDELYAEFEEQDGWDWAIPVLFMRGDGRLFDLAASVSGVPAVSRSEVLPPRRRGVQPDLSEDGKVDQRLPRTDTTEQRLAIYQAMVELDQDELELIWSVLWRPPPYDLPGDQVQRIRVMMDSCTTGEEIEHLWQAVQLQLKLHSKRLLLEHSTLVAQSEKVVDLEEFRTLGRRAS